jgi:hypothetical protein
MHHNEFEYFQSDLIYFIITLIFCLIFPIPLYCEWTYTGTRQSLRGLNPYNLQTSLIVSLSFAFPLCVEFILNIVSGRVKRGRIGHTALLASLLLPDIILYFLAIPWESSEILACVDPLRFSLIGYGILSHLLQTGVEIFHSPYMIIIVICCNLAFLFLLLEQFQTSSSHQENILYLLGISFAFLAFILIIYVIRLCCSPILRKQLIIWNKSDYTIILYVFILLSLGVIQTIRTIFANDDHTNFNVGTTLLIGYIYIHLYSIYNCISI